ncbi:hypothetical protein QCA50_007988 [Cerrena zonata]|uniref:Uncharacterized protein n=1 Tax=Cerrena zonata TaxID=2478898 RepID=A0AAW0GHJ9_9APHY
MVILSDHFNRHRSGTSSVASAFSLALQPPVAGITSNWCLLTVLLVLAVILIPAVNNNNVNTAVVDLSPSPVASITSNWCLLVLGLLVLEPRGILDPSGAGPDPHHQVLWFRVFGWVGRITQSLTPSKCRYRLALRHQPADESAPISTLRLLFRPQHRSAILPLPKLSEPPKSARSLSCLGTPPPPWVCDFCHVFETEHAFVVSNVKYLAPQPPGNGKDLDPGEPFHLDLLKKTSWATDCF